MSLLDCTFENQIRMTRRDAREEGREEERRKIYRMIHDCIISYEEGAKYLEISEHELKERMRLAGFI